MTERQHDWIWEETSHLARQIQRRIESEKSTNRCGNSRLAIIGPEITSMLKENWPETYQVGVLRGWIEVHP